MTTSHNIGVAGAQVAAKTAVAVKAGSAAVSTAVSRKIEQYKETRVRKTIEAAKATGATEDLLTLSLRKLPLLLLAGYESEHDHACKAVAARLAATMFKYSSIEAMMELGRVLEEAALASMGVDRDILEQPGCWFRFKKSMSRTSRRVFKGKSKDSADRQEMVDDLVVHLVAVAETPGGIPAMEKSVKDSCQRVLELSQAHITALHGAVSSSPAPAVADKLSALKRKPADSILTLSKVVKDAADRQMAEHKRELARAQAYIQEEEARQQKIAADKAAAAPPPPAAAGAVPAVQQNVAQPATQAAAVAAPAVPAQV
eukprot:jgi/Mesvir1/27174/Mv20834-RA.1